MSYLEHFAVFAILIIALFVGMDVAAWLGGWPASIAYGLTLLGAYAICVWGVHPFRDS